jgi:hypothetical protein
MSGWKEEIRTEKHADVLTEFQNILCRQMCDASG